jgi:hypothetical protein
MEKRFGIYKVRMGYANDLIKGPVIYLGAPIHEDTKTPLSYGDRASLAERIAQRIATECRYRVLVATFDDDKPFDIEPMYFVSPEVSHD